MAAFALEKRVDDFSFQVSSPLDDRFWFRLVRRDGGDCITDFFLGSFAPSQGGPLLVECYRLLGLAPRAPLTFGDVLAGAKASPVEVASAQDRLASAGSTLLHAFGWTPQEICVETSGGKVQVVLHAERT